MNGKKRREQRKQYYLRNKDKMKKYQKEYYLRNKNKIKERDMQRYYRNKDKFKEWSKQYQLRNKDRISKLHKKYYLKNKDKIIESRKQYYQKNKGKINEHVMQYATKRRASDENFLIRLRLRSSLYYALNYYTRTGKILSSRKYGIDLRTIIKKLTPLPFPISERSKWHIDHVRPISSFDLTNPEEIRKCFSADNLQWLTAKENLSKGAQK